MEGNDKGFLEVRPTPYNVVLEDDTYEGEIKIGLKFFPNVRMLKHKTYCLFLLWFCFKALEQEVSTWPYFCRKQRIQTEEYMSNRNRNQDNRYVEPSWISLESHGEGSCFSIIVIVKTSKRKFRRQLGCNKVFFRTGNWLILVVFVALEW